MDHHCCSCGKEEAKSICSRCKSARYCSSTCQKAHWPQHKPVCVSDAKNVGVAAKQPKTVCACEKANCVHVIPTKDVKVDATGIDVESTLASNGMVRASQHRVVTLVPLSEDSGVDEFFAHLDDPCFMNPEGAVQKFSAKRPEHRSFQVELADDKGKLAMSFLIAPSPQVEEEQLPKAQDSPLGQSEHDGAVEQVLCPAHADGNMDVLHRERLWEEELVREALKWNIYNVSDIVLLMSWKEVELHCHNLGKFRSSRIFFLFEMLKRRFHHAPTARLSILVTETQKVTDEQAETVVKFLESICTVRLVAWFTKSSQVSELQQEEPRMTARRNVLMQWLTNAKILPDIPLCKMPQMEIYGKHAELELGRVKTLLTLPRSKSKMERVLQDLRDNYTPWILISRDLANDFNKTVERVSKRRK